MKCPICKGVGNIQDPKTFTPKYFSNRRKEMVKILLKNGYGIREIQRLVGFKSSQSVSKIKDE